MITIIDVRNTYYESSAKVSELCRQLAFAGIAIVWIFKEEKENTINIPNDLLYSLKLLILALIFDFLHYVVKTIIWGTYNLYKEEKVKYNIEKKFTVPVSFNYIPQVFFILKILFLIGAYYFLLNALSNQYIK